MPNNITVIEETATGQNQKFYDQVKRTTMTRGQFADEIEKGNYPDYHIMHVQKNNRVERIPRSNPDNKTSNNLG